MKILFIIILFIFYIVINAGCGYESCAEANYSFAIHSQVFPEKDSINIGDTLFLISSTPKSMMDIKSRTTIDYTNSINFGTVLSIGELIKDSTVPRGAVFDFDYLSIKGRIYNDVSIPSPNTVQQLTYGESDTQYELKIAIIPKRKGVYAMGVGDGLSSGRHGGSGVCQKASLGISLINPQQHTYFYQLWRPGYTLTNTELKHLYCFKVH